MDFRLCFLDRRWVPSVRFGPEVGYLRLGWIGGGCLWLDVWWTGGGLPPVRLDRRWVPPVGCLVDRRWGSKGDEHKPLWGGQEGSSPGGFSKEWGPKALRDQGGEGPKTKPKTPLQGPKRGAPTPLQLAPPLPFIEVRGVKRRNWRWGTSGWMGDRRYPTYGWGCNQSPPPLVWRGDGGTSGTPTSGWGG
ncbi:hypothetical protein Taro_019541 [Colocasia esculenta]|uniref:Uncharacterized protein n=1 Tax=Colocasia esculenta TaxID=4460 RepID=A0A843UU62_COLES|nr:hypothetical protein [Colocasia esculenta]